MNVFLDYQNEIREKYKQRNYLTCIRCRKTFEVPLTHHTIRLCEKCHKIVEYGDPKIRCTSCHLNFQTKQDLKNHKYEKHAI